MNSTQHSALSTQHSALSTQHSLLGSLRLLWAFVVRDFRIETSYRLSFIFSITGLFFNLITFFFVSEFVSDSQTVATRLADYGGNYFAFVIIGIAFGGYFSTGLHGFANALRQAQTTGTLEAMLMTPTSISLMIIGSAGWNYLFTTFRVCLYLLFGVWWFGLDLSRANFAAAFVVFVLSIIAFASIGILAAGFIIVIKRGDPVTTLFGHFTNLVGGVYYTVDTLPAFLQTIAKLLPITYALQAMRQTLLLGASWLEVWPDLQILLIFCVVLAPTSLILFRYAVNRARQDGSLAHY